MVVVGASLAGLRAVEAARAAGWSDQVVLLGAEDHLPYDRPPLSKAFLDAGTTAAPTTLRSAEALAALGVTLRLGESATALDLGARTLEVGGAEQPYSALIVATGATARHLDVAGADLPGVLTLRTLADATALRAGLDSGARVVVVGAGFIGSEVASAVRARGAPVTLVEAAPVPMVRALGAEMAGVVAGLHTRAGADLRCGVGVVALHGSTAVTGVELADGTLLPADLVVVGVGAEPATGWLATSGLHLDDGVVCDPTLKAAEGVWAAGDLARYPHPLAVGTHRLEHWTAAAEQGALAARNAVDPAGAQPHTAVPYFWSDLYGSRLQRVGVADADEVVLVGDPGSASWVALYRRGDRLVGALSLNLPGRIMKFRALLARGGSFDEAAGLAATVPGLVSGALTA